MSLRGMVVLFAVAVSAPSHAQHAGHAMSPAASDTTRPSAHVMAQLIPLVTRAAPSAERATHTQAVLTQAMVMSRVVLPRWRVEAHLTLDAEGLTMPDGELNTGAYGEGFVDKRHPHTYLHELILSARRTRGPVTFALSGGRGVVPFGTDDPMARPHVKYPINHHLSQILERAALILATRYRGVIVEGSTFGGDEPSEPSSMPRADRFGDSWSVRTTLIPMTGMELQGSYARVTSPEEVEGHGLNQRKQSLSARSASHNGHQ